MASPADGYYMRTSMDRSMEDDERPRLSTNQKALKINLDPVFYGTFAEIGAGQEVARWFFKVGAAAGTISKSISAYDMAVSDAIYGRCKRYVSRERLQGMLDHEHGLNLERLKISRGDTTAFFTFANTVAARNYQGTNECHGWMGVKYQTRPRDEDSQIIIHVRMLDQENDLQHETLGIVGVNLLYGAFFLHHKPQVLLESLLDNLTTKRVEIDMIHCAHERFAAEPEVETGQIVELMEITMRNLLAGGQIDLTDFLARADVLAAAGKTVLISDYFEYYRLAAYLTRYTSQPIAVTMGVASLEDLFKEHYYAELEGGILEAFGRLFTKDLRIYVYPLRDPATQEITTVQNIKMPGDLHSLYRYLVERGRIKQLDNFDESVLHIFSRDVLRRIKEEDASWETMVPPEIADVIKRRRFFGYRESEMTDVSQPR